MKFRVLSFVLAMLIVFTSVSLTAFATGEEKSIVKIDLTATQKLLENCDGVFQKENGKTYFEYDISKTKPSAKVLYSDGSTEEISAEKFKDFAKNSSFYIEQGAGEKELKPNEEYTATAVVNGVATTIVFSIEPNSIKSIEVEVKKQLKEDINGEYKDGYFHYELPEDSTYITISYKDATKEKETYLLKDIYKETGENIEVDLGQSKESPLKPGYHSGTAIFKGALCTFNFEIIENNIASIIVTATQDLIEYKDGSYKKDENGKEFFCYDLKLSRPQLTIVYKEGYEETISYEDMCNIGIADSVELYIEQSFEKQLSRGTYTAVASYEGRKCEFKFNIVDDPVRNIVVTPTRDLVEFTDGFINTDSENKEYFHYNLEATFPTVKINFKDGTSVTYDYEEVKRFFEVEFSFDAKQSSSNQLVVGKNSARARFSYYECDFQFNIVKSEKTVSGLVVSPENTFIKNSFGVSETEEYYKYYEDAVSYRVLVKYSDGEAKEFNNVKNGDLLDGSLFYVKLNQSQEKPFTVGENKAIGYFKNKSAEFKVVLEENQYKAIAISGNNELILTLTDNAGEKEDFKVLDFKAIEVTYQNIKGVLYTDKRAFLVDVICEYSSDISNIKIKLFDGRNTITSNTLSKNNWLNMLLHIEGVAYSASAFSDGWSEIYTDKEFLRFDNQIKPDEIDNMLSLIPVTEYSDNFEFKYDEIGFYVNASVEQAKELSSMYFDASKVDFTLSPNYNKDTKTIRINIIPKAEGLLTDSCLEYKDNYFVYTSQYNALYSMDSFIVQVVANNDGKIVAIAFEKGECLPVNDVTVTNAKAGVKITWSDSENAFYYDIYKSVDGKKYEKIATSYISQYIDEDVVSCGTYTYKIKAFNLNTESDFSSAKTTSYLKEPKVSVSTAKTGFTVKWNQIEGAAGYIVYRSEYADGKWLSWAIINKAKPSVTSYLDKNIEIGKVYKYTVRAYNSDAKSSYTSTSQIVYLNTPKVAVANAKGGVQVNWNAIDGASGYAVYRSRNVDGHWTSWEKLLTVGTAVKTYLDYTAVSGEIYRYTVRAVNGVSKSGYVASNTLFYLAEPTVKISNTKTGVYVKWTQAGGAIGYTVYRSQYNASTKKWSAWKNMGTAKATKLAWTDKSAQNNVAYKYTVRAVNQKVRSSYTATPTLVYVSQPTVTTSISKTGVTVKWNKINSVTGYNIYRTELIEGKWTKWRCLTTVKADVTSWVDKNLNSGATYKYTVRAKNGNYLSSYTATKELMYLGVPSVSISNASTGIKVSWSKVSGATGYTVYRSMYDTSTKKWSAWKNMGTAKAEKSSWIDKKVGSGYTYKYTVRAVNGSIKSAYVSSNSLMFLTQPKVTVSANDNGILVKWTKSDGALGYTVYRQEMIAGNWSSWENMGTAKATKSAWTDKRAAEDVIYRYTVRAVNGKTRSAYTASSKVIR